MYCAYFVVLFGCLAGNTLAGYHPQFYTAGLPQFNNYYTPYQQPFYQPQYSPTLYSAFPQVYQPQTFGYHHQAPSQFLPVQANRNFNVQSRGNLQPQATLAGISQSYESEKSDNFRGYAYHTEFGNEGHSNVIFLTGPEVNQFRNAQSKIANARSSASDSVDTIATTAETNPSIETIVQFLENPRVGVQRFYSINNALVARDLNDEIAQAPAATLPLKEPISPIFPILRSSFSIDKTESAEKKDEVEPVIAASERKSQTTEVTTTEKATTEALSTSTAAAPTTTVAATTTTTTAAPTTAAVETSTTIRSTMAPIIVEDSDSEMMP